MIHPTAFLSALALLAAAVPVSAQVLNEESFLEVRRKPFRLQWVNNLALEGPWLAAGGTTIEGFSGLAVYERKGASWVPHSLPAGGDVDMDGNRLVVADTEGSTSVFKLENGAWVHEASMLDRFATLQGNRMLTWRYHYDPPWGVTVRKLGSGDWLPETMIVPEAPQAYYTSCCFPMSIWGNIAVFGATGTGGTQALYVYVRVGGAWTKDLELTATKSIGPIALEGRTLVTVENDATGGTVVIRERERGTWQERARFAPGGYVWDAALEGDTLALGSDLTQGVVRVYERSLGTWNLTAVLAASDGLALGASVAIEGRTLVAGTRSDNPRPRLARVYVFKLPPVARITLYGCGDNPEGSLSVRSGAPTAGGRLRLAFDNPLATQAPGSLVYLAVSSRPDARYPCGTRLPALGMDGGAGERLVPDTVEFTRFVGTWQGEALEAEFEIPADASLVGRRLFVQGMIHDPSSSASVPWGLTQAVELEIGAPSRP